MMRYFLTLLVILFSFQLNAGSLIYDLSTKEIKGIIRGGMQPSYNSETEGIIDISDESFIFSTFTYHAKVVGNIVVMKDSEEIDIVNKNRRKITIRNDIRKLIQLYKEAMQEYAEGFDVSVETTSIRTKVIQLKQEYQGL